MKFLIFLSLFVTLLVTNVNPHNDKSYNDAAIQINMRAIKFGTLNKSNLSRKDLSVKMLTILDSAIRVDRSYPYPYFNKVASFVELGLYNEAIKNVEKTIALLPGFQPAYLRAALIYQFYIKDFSKARAYYRKAYGVANQAGKNNKHVKLDLDLNIAHALYFYKGRSESLTYIDSIKKYYSNDPKSISTIESFKRLISQPLTEMNVKGSFAAYFK